METENIKLCKKCKVNPVKPRGNARRPYTLCVDCWREHKRLEMQALRDKKKALVPEDKEKGLKRCTKCNKLKPYSAFSETKRDRCKKLNKICDACLAKLYTSQKKFDEGFTDTFWRRRAYSVNTSHRNIIAREKGVAYTEIQIDDLDYVCKPLDLLDLYKQQNGKCKYCGVELTTKNLEVEHMDPKSVSLDLSLGNLCLSCKDCNALKGEKSMDEFLAFLPVYIARFINRVQE